MVVYTILCTTVRVSIRAVQQVLLQSKQKERLHVPLHAIGEHLRANHSEGFDPSSLFPPSPEGV